MARALSDRTRFLYGAAGTLAVEVYRIYLLALSGVEVLPLSEVLLPDFAGTGNIWWSLCHVVGRKQEMEVHLSRRKRYDLDLGLVQASHLTSEKQRGGELVVA